MRKKHVTSVFSGTLLTHGAVSPCGREAVNWVMTDSLVVTAAAASRYLSYWQFSGKTEHWYFGHVSHCHIVRNQDILIASMFREWCDEFWLLKSLVLETFFEFLVKVTLGVKETVARTAAVFLMIIKIVIEGENIICKNISFQFMHFFFTV